MNFSNYFAQALEAFGAVGGALLVIGAFSKK